VVGDEAPDGVRVEGSAVGGDALDGGALGGDPAGSDPTGADEMPGDGATGGDAMFGGDGTGMDAVLSGGDAIGGAIGGGMIGGPTGLGALVGATSPLTSVSGRRRPFAGRVTSSSTARPFLSTERWSDSSDLRRVAPGSVPGGPGFEALETPASTRPDSTPPVRV
jgi:hypothetical protein